MAPRRAEYFIKSYFRRYNTAEYRIDNLVRYTFITMVDIWLADELDKAAKEAVA